MANVHFVGSVALDSPEEVFAAIGQHCGPYLKRVPVPIDRIDDAYFAPLKDLQLQPGTELYLGLVHAQDGIEGTKKRIAAAKKYVPKFSIGSECGISRGRNADLAMDFIKTYAAAAATA